jgi:hypothetical protein
MACCEKPSPVGPPKPRWVDAGLELAAMAAGAPPPRGGHASIDVAVPSSLPDFRSTSPPRTIAGTRFADKEEAATA